MQASSTLSAKSDPDVQAVGMKRKRGKSAAVADFFKLAKGAGGFETKKEARETLQRAGFTFSISSVDSLLSAAEFIRTARRNRQQSNILKRLGHIPSTSAGIKGRPLVLLPAGNPAERLKNVRKQCVAKTARKLMRHGAAGGHSMRVEFAIDASQVRYVVTLSENRVTYGGSYKGWSAREDHHVITIPKDWRTRVERKSLACLGGLMTLDAHPLIPDGDVLVFAATWARQGRSYCVTVDRGYIALLSGEHFHADSAQEAIKGVRRKVKVGQSPTKQKVCPYTLTVEAFIKKYESKKFNVLVSDAEESGACEFGIRSWCAAVGLDYESGGAPLKEILRGFRIRPQEEVRRAVIHAARRNRAERKDVS